MKRFMLQNYTNFLCMACGVFNIFMYINGSHLTASLLLGIFGISTGVSCLVANIVVNKIKLIIEDC